MPRDGWCVLFARRWWLLYFAFVSALCCVCLLCVVCFCVVCDLKFVFRSLCVMWLLLLVVFMCIVCCVIYDG